MSADLPPSVEKSEAAFSRAVRPGWAYFKEVYENGSCRCFPCDSLCVSIRMERVLIFLSRGPIGICGPILLLLVCLWLGRGERSPWYVKAVLLALLLLLLLIMFGPAFAEGGSL